MSRPKKDAKILNIKLSKPVFTELNQFCDENGITKTIAVEKLLHIWLKEYFKRPPEERTVFELSRLS